MGEFHSPKSASGAPKWGQCAGSITLEQRMRDEGYEDTGSAYADEGTAAHTLGATCLTLRKQAADFLGEVIHVGESLFTVTREMAVAVQEYLDAIWEIGADDHLIEERVSFDAWVPGNSGTLDHAAFKDGHVWVDDYKHGAGVPVDAVGNEQLVLYAAGLIETYDFAYEMHTFHLRIHQPRAGGTTEWVLSRAELLAHAADLRGKAARCDAPDAPLVPGSKQCQFCKAHPRCPARVAELLTVIVGGCEVPQLTVADVDLLTIDQLSTVMGYFEAADKFMKKARAFAQAEIESGRGFPGWKVIEGESRRKWKDEEAAKLDFAALGFERKEYIKESLIGITDATKLLPKVDRENFLSTHTEKPKGSPKLVQESHPAPAMTSVGQLLDSFDNDL